MLGVGDFSLWPHSHLPVFAAAFPQLPGPGVPDFAVCPKASMKEDA